MENHPIPVLILRPGIAQQNSNMPPTPPLPPLYPPSNFEYLLPGNQKYVKDAYDVISQNEWWRPFREALLSRGVDNRAGFTFSTDPLYSKIKSALCSTSVGWAHSGMSVGFVMREMEFIALNGEPAYRIRHQGAAE